MANDETQPMVTSSRTGSDATQRLREHQAVAEEQFEESFRQEHPVIWLLTLVAPFALTAALLVVIAVVAGPQTAQRLIWTALASFFFFGKFVILGGSHDALAEMQRFFTPGQLVLLVLWMDLMTASLLVFHAGVLFKLPFIGQKLGELVEDGQFILQQNPWMKRATFVGIVAFVTFPLAATGSVGGSIFGRLLGMSRLATFVGIATGSLLGCGMMYFGAGLINRYINRDDPLLTISGIAVVAAIILVLNLRYRQIKAQHRKLREESPAAPVTE